jgi:HD superfamily phosphodiesterase
MSCDSSFAKEIIQYCAKVCDDCAKECGSHDMDHCKKCAVVCLECSKMCQEMATK